MNIIKVIHSFIPDATLPKDNPPLNELLGIPNWALTTIIIQFLTITACLIAILILINKSRK